MPSAPKEEDAALMMAASTTTPAASSSDANHTNNSNSSATNALARSNLLRLETSELIRESTLHIHPTGDSSHVHYEAKWSPSVRSYFSQIKEVIGGLDAASLSPEVALLPNNSGGDAKSGASGGGDVYRIPLLSDKFHKSSSQNNSNTNTNNSNPLTSWSFPFQGGQTLELHPIGSWAHVGNAGLTNKHANGGNVLPVLDVAVLVDGQSLDSEEEDAAFVGGKDYLNHRYTDKRNILAVHLAKQLSQKKHRSKVGAVHLTQIFGDSRKVGLMLTPPVDEDEGGKKSSKKVSKDKKNKRKRDNDEEGKEDKDKKGKKNKLRFRIRLIFGVKQDEQKSLHDKHQQHDSDDEYSSDEEMEHTHNISQINSWIPRSRLLPNRNNHRSTKHPTDNDHASSILNSTPHYTNSLAEDLHLLSTSQLISSTLSTLTPTSGSNITPTSTFHETLLLLKVWALQRGFLRGHDTFTTTTLAVILVYLYRTKAIGKRMGSVQAFTTFMKFWSECDWLGETATGAADKGALDAWEVRERKAKKKAAFVIPTQGRNEAQTIAHCTQARLYLEDIRGSSTDATTPKTLLDCFKLCYTSSSTTSSSIPNNSHNDSPILLDPTMTLNYLARLSPSFVRESQAEAYAALRYIHGQEVEGSSEGGVFRNLFLETKRFWTRYDAYVRVPLSCVPKIMGTTGGGGKKKSGKSKGANITSGSKVWGHDVDDLGYDESVRRGVVEVLHRALGDRVLAIRAFTGGNGDICGAAVSSSSEDVATRVIVDSDECISVPIRGSSAASFGYAAKFGDRSPTLPALSSGGTAGKEEGKYLVLGLRIDPNTSRRIVDRGPPAEDVQGSNAFVTLWGEQFAQLRRFQDGAIVRAVVWNNAISTKENVQFSGIDRSMGGIVERIVQHIIKLHFMDGKSVKQKKSGGSTKKDVSFELRNMISFIDGIAPSSSSSPQAASPFSDSLALHKNVMMAFDSLSEFLRQNTKTSTDTTSLGNKGKKVSKLGLPLSIDEVEPLSPCLRYSALFPPVPHPLLGGDDTNLLGGSEKRKISGVNVGSPILVQIRFEGSSKWPTSLNAMGAAKCAMLVKLAEGIEKMKQEQQHNGDLDAFDGPMDVTPNYLDIGYCGYSWRIIVRADQEMRMLKKLRNPTVEAKALQLSLVDRHVRGAMHHSLIHAVHTRHPSASSVVRLAHRWVASHMLSDMIPQNAIELLVAKIYTESVTDEKRSSSRKLVVDTPPSTVVAGFLRFLSLLSSHDWAREPLIVDPQNHISSHDRGLIHAQFNTIRGPEFKNGPAMYIISPADYDGVEEMVGSKVVGENGTSQQTLTAANATEKVWAPTVTSKFPERVVLSRAAALAKCSHDHLTKCIMRGNIGNGWVASFQESSSSLTSYSALLRVDPSFITDPGCSSTNADCIVGAKSKADANEQPCGPFEKSLQKRYAGPKELRKKHFKNLVLEKDTLHDWQPVKSLVNTLRSKYSEYAVFFYNEFAPDVIAMIWRPVAFNKPQPFSAIVSDFKRPVSEFWTEDSLVTTNTDDLMGEIGYLSRNIVSNFKVFDTKKPSDAPVEKHQKKPRKSNDDDDDDESSDSDEE